MSETANNEGASETEKPVHDDVKFPPFPEPTDEDFDEDIAEDERNYYKEKFKDLNSIKNYRLHCTSCDRHMGCSSRNERIRAHPMLRTLVCHTCHTFYNSGEFEKGDDGSELYCRWCGQGGQVYCCSDCPHVFCAKCIKRNMGTNKIKEIESADDWKCFKCNPNCVMELRAICWALLRYCDLKNKITYQTQDPELKTALQKKCALDESECCKHRTNKRNQKLNETLNKKKDKDIIKKESDAKLAANIISKMPSTIQVKKFASVNPEDNSKSDKKAQKRSASPKSRQILVKNPISLAPVTKILTPVVPPLAKKLRLPNTLTTMRFSTIPDRKIVNTYTRIRPKVNAQLPIPIANNCFNGLGTNLFQCSNTINDNINLSLESLTQGLDLAAIGGLNNDVVCTPDFPLEPLCEVTEDNDDDVQCITPGPVAAPKPNNAPPLPPLVPRNTSTQVSEITAENIIQMTDNDVTVNESTGGLKFRVDPQTLSSNKMYRLPDGRIFAINANPNMPGGYSATIVAVTEASKGIPKGATFAAKLSSVSTSTPTSKNNRNQVPRLLNSKRGTLKSGKSAKTSDTSTRACDLNVPVEWYRYNLIDAVDALEYSLSRLHKLKKEATSVYLRTRSVNEMRSLHRTLERLLNTSTTRFKEIRDNLNKGLQQYISKKASGNSSEEDDDVEILPDVEEDPIFIDENSVESNINEGENQEVDLTGPGSSEYNDSGENRNDRFSKSDNTFNNSEEDSLNVQFKSILRKRNSLIHVKQPNRNNENKINGNENTQKESATVTLIKDDFKCLESIDDISDAIEGLPNERETQSNKGEDESYDLLSSTNINNKDDSGGSHDKVKDLDDNDLGAKDKQGSGNETQDLSDKSADLHFKIEHSDDTKRDNAIKNEEEDEIDDTKNDINNMDEKMHDSDISAEIIETLLKDDNSQDNDATNSEVTEALKVI